MGRFAWATAGLRQSPQLDLRRHVSCVTSAAQRRPEMAETKRENEPFSNSQKMETLIERRNSTPKFHNLTDTIRKSIFYEAIDIV